MGRGGKLSFFRHFCPSRHGYVAGARGAQTQTGRSRTAGILPIVRLSINSSSSRLLKPSSVFPLLPKYSSSSNSSQPSQSTSSPAQSPDFSQLPGARQPKTAVSRPSSKLLEINKKQAADAFQHCLQLVRKHDVDTYLSILTMPKKVQPELLALHAFNVELALIRDKVDVRSQNNTSAIYRLQFWKDALSSIYGQAASPVPRQPVAIALCAFAPNCEPSLLENLVLARQQTIGDRPFSNVFELCGYGARTSGSLLQLTCSVLFGHRIDDHYPQEEIQKAATDIGAAYAVANHIRSTLPLLSRGVVLIPQDLMHLNNLTADKIYHNKQPEDMKHVVKDMVRVCEQQLSSGRCRVNSLPKTVRPAFFANTAATEYLLRNIKKVDYDVYSSVLQRRNPLFLWVILYKKLLGRC